MSDNLKLFPYTLIRLSGGSMDSLSSLNAVKTYTVLEEIYKIRAEIEFLKNKINEILFEQISQVSDGDAQKRILNLKRDIFNERTIEIADLDVVRIFLSASAITEIELYLSLRNTYLELKKKGEAIFNSESESLHENLKKLCSNETLQKGLLLSSQSLLDRITHYLKKDSAAMRKKESQTENGLIKYITRMHAKTSPFSTFTNLALGKFGNMEGDQVLQRAEISEDNVISHVRLNNYLYQYIKTLLLANKNIYQWFLIRVNPTIQNKGDHYLFLTNDNNLESFQRFPANPVLELLKDLASEGKEGIVYRELVNLIVRGEYIEAEPKDIEKYINQLIEYGFFEFNIGVSGIDTDWDKKLIARILPIAPKEHLLTELMDALIKMRELAMNYGKSSVAGRRKILDDAFGCFRGICMKLHEAAGLPADERKSREELEKEWRKKAEEEKARAEKKKKEDKELKIRRDSAPVEEAIKKEEKKEENGEEKKEDIIFKHRSSTFFHFKPEQLFYEDSGFNIELKLSQESLQQFTSKVDAVVSQMVLFEGNFEERQRMKHFFTIKYPPGQKIDLLTFYEDYFKEYKKEEKDFYDQKNKENIKVAQQYVEKEKQLETKKEEISNLKKELEEKIKIIVPDKFRVKAVEQRSEKVKTWYELLVKEYETVVNGNQSEILNLSSKPVQSVNEKINFSNTGIEAQGSYGIFVQLFEEEKKEDGSTRLMGVLNASFPGYGKLVSRFLHIFDSSFTDEIRKWNFSMQGDESIFAEDCDASYFNANLHPPLMPAEVWIPNGHNSLPAEKQLPVTDLTVSYNEGEDNLRLLERSTGKQIYVFDLGFQGHGGRSQLFQLLDKFSKVKNLSWHPILNALGVKTEDKEADKKTERRISVRPRVVLDEQLIIQRKAWFVPKELAPLRKNTESDWDYFERLNVWRVGNKMPEEIFVFIYSRNQRFENEEQAKNAAKIGRDDYKPQYINFTNPYLVNLFEKLLLKVPVQLRIEEMLPNSQQLFEFGNQKHIAEFVVQWYKY